MIWAFILWGIAAPMLMAGQDSKTGDYTLTVSIKEPMKLFCAGPGIWIAYAVNKIFKTLLK